MIEGRKLINEGVIKYGKIKEKKIQNQKVWSKTYWKTKWKMRNKKFWWKMELEHGCTKLCQAHQLGYGLTRLELKLVWKRRRTYFWTVSDIDVD